MTAHPSRRSFLGAAAVGGLFAGGVLAVDDRDVPLAPPDKQPPDLKLPDEPLRPVRMEAPMQSSWLDERLGDDSRVLWGMGEWPMPMLEAERPSIRRPLDLLDTRYRARRQECHERLAVERLPAGQP